MSPPNDTPTSTPAADLQVSMPTVVRFVRQLSHDLRNNLNAAELQSAYLKEIAEDAEVKSEIQRLRAMLSEMGASLQKLTVLLAPPKLNELTYASSDLMEDLRAKAAMEFPEESAAFEWGATGDAAMLNVDPHLILDAFLELLRNALRHGRGEGRISVSGQTDGGEFVFTLREPKTAFDSSTENWGREPFSAVKHGHYSLGLHRARNIVEAHHGRLKAHYDGGDSVLVTTVILPTADAS